MEAGSQAHLPDGQAVLRHAEGAPCRECRLRVVQPGGCFAEEDVSAGAYSSCVASRWTAGTAATETGQQYARTSGASSGELGPALDG